MITHHFILVKNLNDDGRWISLDFLPGPVDENLIKDKQFIPRRTQCFVNHLSHLAVLANNDSGKWV